MNTEAPAPDATDEQDRLDMKRLTRGDEDSLNQLMERHGSRLFHYLIRQTGSEQDAADLAQETFVRVYQARERFDTKARFTTWLYTIATNLARNRHRWKHRHPEVSIESTAQPDGPTLGETLVAQDSHPSDNLQQGERNQIIRDAVLSLPEKLREPLVLAEYQDCSMKEISEILFCSVKAVESRLARARQDLREKLASLWSF